MNVLHINSSIKGGAALCARRINNALEEYGIDSRMLFGKGDYLPEGIKGAIAEKDWYPWNKNSFTKIIRALLNRCPPVNDADRFRHRIHIKNKRLPSPLYIHQPYSNYRNISHHPLVQWADIIHLHDVTDFVDYSTFFKEVKKPIVWTLHDKFPAEGVRHCCSEFFQLPNSLKKINDQCIEIKRKGVISARNLHIVAISQQMKTICSESKVLYDFPTTLIHNGVDCSIFKPTAVQHQLLAKMHGKTIFLFSSYLVWDRNKGLQRAIDALERVHCENKVLVVVGNYEGREPSATFPVYCLGLVSNQLELASIYSTSDFLIQASLEETFSQTPLEVMACGTPVISTPCSGAIDLIYPFNGVLCSDFSSESIANGIKEALSVKYNSTEINQYILDNYDYKKIARKYVQLYESLL